MKELYLPNKQGHYNPVKVPAYLDDVLFDRRWGKCRLRIEEIGAYTYRIRGWNAGRKAYGIEKDIELLKHFLDRYAVFEDGSMLETITNIRFNKHPKNYYVTFEMMDPFAHEFEKAGLIDRMK